MVWLVLFLLYNETGYVQIGAVEPGPQGKTWGRVTGSSTLTYSRERETEV